MVNRDTMGETETKLFCTTLFSKKWTHNLKTEGSLYCRNKKGKTWKKEVFRIFTQDWHWTLTSLPSLTPISWATRAATLMAATRRGCVQPIFLLLCVNPPSYKYCGIWVVFPDPVSPSMIRTYKRKLAVTEGFPCPSLIKINFPALDLTLYDTIQKISYLNQW